MIISIDAEKASDKMGHPFKIKALRKLGIEGHFPNMIKGISKISKKTRMPAFTTAIQHSTESSSQSNQARKKIKDMQTGKEEVKLFLLTGDVTLYAENPKESTKDYSGKFQSTRSTHKNQLCFCTVKMDN